MDHDVCNLGHTFRITMLTRPSTGVKSRQSGTNEWSRFVSSRQSNRFISSLFHANNRDHTIQTRHAANRPITRISLLARALSANSPTASTLQRKSERAIKTLTQTRCSNDSTSCLWTSHSPKHTQARTELNHHHHANLPAIAHDGEQQQLCCTTTAAQQQQSQHGQQ